MDDIIYGFKAFNKGLVNRYGTKYELNKHYHYWKTSTYGIISLLGIIAYGIIIVMSILGLVPRLLGGALTSLLIGSSMIKSLVTTLVSLVITLINAGLYVAALSKAEPIPDDEIQDDGNYAEEANYDSGDEFDNYDGYDDSYDGQ